MIKTHPYPDLDLSVSDSGRCVDISYSCPGRCKFALYENMPPEDDDICCFSDCKNFNTCSRRLTDAVERAAELLRLPICQFAEQPGCFVAKKQPQTGYMK